MGLIDEIKNQVGYVDAIIWAPCVGNEGIEKNKKYEAVVLLRDIEKIFADRPSEVGVRPKIVKTLREKIEEAFNDMTTIYAPELTGDGKDKLAKKIQKYGKGTLGYISDKRNEAIKTLEELLSNFMV